MRFGYAFAPRPAEEEVLRAVDAAAGRLYRKLRELNIDALAISDYNKRYLQDYRRNLDNTMQRYSYLLSLALAGAGRRAASQVFLDYGGGAGVLACLAKEAGLGTVLYNDIYDVSCADAAVIARAMDVPADAYIQGDIEDVVAWCRQRQISVDAVANWDVLEHVYDTEFFLSQLPQLSRGGLRVVMACSANGFNPLVRRQIMRTQRQVELEDRPRQWGQKERDERRAYLSVRREIIAGCAAGLAAAELEELARRTRGLVAADVRARAADYLQTRRYPPEPEHPTNTCDPTTGNWCERLLKADRLRSALEPYGFQVTILPGFYGRFGRRPVRAAGYVLNLAIRTLGSRGLPLALYYILHAARPPALPGSAHLLRP